MACGAAFKVRPHARQIRVRVCVGKFAVDILIKQLEALFARDFRTDGAEYASEDAGERRLRLLALSGLLLVTSLLRFFAVGSRIPARLVLRAFAARVVQRFVERPACCRAVPRGRRWGRR